MDSHIGLVADSMTNTMRDSVVVYAERPATLPASFLG
jgi:hypothetical protein